MRRWDAALDGYLKECETRGLSKSTVTYRTVELERLGAWLKRRKPRPQLDAVDSDLLIGYLRQRTTFRSKSTICGITSALRNMGEYLLKEGLWIKNPLRWIRGPKLDGRMKIPRRIGRDQKAVRVKPCNSK